MKQNQNETKSKWNKAKMKQNQNEIKAKRNKIKMKQNQNEIKPKWHTGGGTIWVGELYGWGNYMGGGTIWVGELYGWGNYTKPKLNKSSLKSTTALNYINVIKENSFISKKLQKI